MSTISPAARQELVTAVAERYQQSTVAEKGWILDEFVAFTGYHRKHAIRVLNGNTTWPRVVEWLGAEPVDRLRGALPFPLGIGSNAFRRLPHTAGRRRVRYAGPRPTGWPSPFRGRRWPLATSHRCCLAW